MSQLENLLRNQEHATSWPMSDSNSPEAIAVLATDRAQIAEWRRRAER